jgi:nucleotide-binding universal stress UspA family protein
MGYRTILAVIDDAPQSAQQVAIAATLAQQHDARLIGLHVLPALEPMRVAGDSATIKLVRDARAQREERAAAAAAFRSGSQAIRDTSWALVEADLLAVETVASRRARCADLVVVGQIGVGERWEEGPGKLPQQLVMEAGRPVLVVPRYGAFSSIGRRVLVSWNQSREAARALADAMPILAKAEQVFVLTIDETDRRSRTGEDPRADNAVDYLAAHGIAAKALHDVTGKVGAGDVLLGRCSDLEIDLLVLGAYGHSRLRERALGGVTRDILTHMTVPTLMSH